MQSVQKGKKKSAACSACWNNEKMHEHEWESRQGSNQKWKTIICSLMKVN